MHFGVHLTIDAYKANPSALANACLIEDILRNLPRQLGMTLIYGPVSVVVGPNNKKDPGGVSGFAMIAESHISIHTFPEKQFLSADVYTCNDELDKEMIIAEFKRHFLFKEVEINYIKRGTHFDNLLKNEQGHCMVNHAIPQVGINR